MPHHDVMVSLLILLIISVVAVVGLQRLRLPAILGYLLVGAIAGLTAFIIKLFGL